MNPFQYAAPDSVEKVVSLLAERGERARLLAGGTDILVQLREGLRQADLVVDVKKIPTLMQMQCDRQTGLRLGAAVPCWRIYENAEVAADYAALVDAVRIIGGWQIQGRASVGGNLCNASPAADAVGPLMVHRALCLIAGPQGQRELPVEQFCTAPGRNALQAGEFLVSLQLAPPAEQSASAYERFIPRNEMDIAVAGVASWVRLDASGRRIEEAHVALAAVAPTARLAEEASRWLAGKPADDETFIEAGRLAQQVCQPIDDMRGTIEYRRHLASVLTRRTLARAVQRVQERS